MEGVSGAVDKLRAQVVTDGEAAAAEAAAAAARLEELRGEAEAGAYTRPRFSST